jgi:hypothetical protein
MTKKDKEWLRQKQAVMAKRYPLENRPFDGSRIRNRSAAEKLMWIVTKACGSKRAFTLDYDQLSAGIFVRCLQKIFESKTLKSLRNTDVVVPLMVNGHVKNMPSCDNVKRILDRLDTFLNGRIVFWTLRDAVEYWSRESISRRIA